MALRVVQGSPTTTDQLHFALQLVVLLPSKGEVKFTSVALKKQEKHHVREEKGCISISKLNGPVMLLGAEVDEHGVACICANELA